MGSSSGQRDVDRIELMRDALERSKMDALVCALPTNVLLLSGYWPVIGTAIAVMTKTGFVHVLAPEDEEELARTGWADVVETFSLGSLEELTTAAAVLRAPLTRILKDIGSQRRITVGCESGPTMEPASYVGVHRYGTVIYRLLTEILPDEAIASADDLMRQVRSVLSPSEQARVRLACDIAGRAFSKGAQRLSSSLKETEVASLFRAALAAYGDSTSNVARVGGFIFCMSGPNSAAAYAAYQRSRPRKIDPGDLVLIHCNSYVDGYWTDITRTFCLDAPDERERRMYEAILAAREVALAAIKPGVRAADVDRAARTVLSQHGFEKEFRHGLGHGVGFAAINHNAVPRLHPASKDVLESGMIFNIEPAIYIDGFGGIRHCDMVLVTDDGPELLTPFQSTIESLTR
jgi:Xaa-Pro aminopeptidase